MPNDFWCCSFLITKIKRKILERFNISLKSLHCCAKLSSCKIFSSSGGNHERTGDQRQAAAFLREELRYRKAVRSKRPYIRCLCKLPRERRCRCGSKFCKCNNRYDFHSVHRTRRCVRFHGIQKKCISWRFHHRRSCSYCCLLD